MKRQRETRFIGGRSVVFSLTAMVLVGLLSALVVPVATGTSLRPEVSQANVEEAETDTPTRLRETSRQSFDDIQFREQNWVLGIGEPNEPPLPVALSRNEIEYMKHNWDFRGGTPLIEAPVRGSSTVESPGIGLSSGMVNRFGPGTPGPGDGLYGYRFIEENVQLPGEQTWRGGPGEGLIGHRFIEENTYLPGPNGSEASGGHPGDQGFSTHGGY